MDPISTSERGITPPRIVAPSLSPSIILEVYMGRSPMPDVNAAAVAILDNLNAFDRTFLVYPNERPLGGAIKSVLTHYNIRGDQLGYLIKILSKLGYAHRFLNLATPKNDTGIKKYLLDNGILWDAIVTYHDVDAWDGLEFSRGFILGLGDSFLQVLAALKDLFGFIFEALTQPYAASQQISKFIQGIQSLTFDTLKNISKGEWEKWQYEFNAALFDLRFDKAGFLLGKLGGDLWQLLTGIAALAKLSGFTMQVARRYAPLFIAKASQSAESLVLLTELIVKIGIKIITELPSIGLKALSSMFEDLGELLKSLKNGVLIFIEKTGRFIFMVPDEGLVLAGYGKLEPGLYLGEQVNGSTNILAKIRTSSSNAMAYVKDTLDQISKDVKKLKPSLQFLIEIHKAEGLAKEFVKEWASTLQKILREDKELNKLLNPGEFGKWLHGHMEMAFQDLSEAMSGKFSSLSEKNIRSLAQKLKLPERLLKRTEISLLDFVKSNKNLMKTLGLKNESDVLSFLKKIGYKDPASTKIGNLICDGILYNEQAGKIISIDWTSSWGRIQFAKEYEAMLAQGKTLTKAQRIEMAIDFIGHGVREYGIRETILEFVFNEDGWETKVLEIGYRPYAR